jgi:death on curing protein
MAEWKHLTREGILAIHDVVQTADGGLAGLRDDNMLESALNAPRATMFGQPLFEDPIEIAAAYLFYLWKNHPFLDGNKCTALAAALVFLAENEVYGHGEAQPLPVDDWERFVLDVAAGRLTRQQTTAGLRALVVPAVEG